LRNARTDVPGLTTKQIYEAVHRQYPSVERTSFPAKMVPNKPGHKSRAFSYTLEPRPPPIPDTEHKDHPVRSIRYLKKFVLEEMAERELLEKIHCPKASLPPEVQQEITPKVVPRNKKLKALLNRKEAWLWRLRPIPEGKDPLADFQGEPDPERAPPRVWSKKREPRRFSPDSDVD